MHWLEQENDGEEEQVEKQRNLEDELDEEENDDYLSKEDRQQKMGSLLERIGGKHEGKEGEMVEMGEKIEEVGDILKESVTTIRGVVETEEDGEEEGKRRCKKWRSKLVKLSPVQISSTTSVTTIDAPATMTKIKR